MKLDGVEGEEEGLEVFLLVRGDGRAIDESRTPDIAFSIP